MGRRYVAFCHFHHTEALYPLHMEAAQAGGEQETYPWSTLTGAAASPGRDAAVHLKPATATPG